MTQKPRRERIRNEDEGKREKGEREKEREGRHVVEA